MLLSSHRPFYHKVRKIMIDRIMRCDYTFEKDYWKPISDEAKDYLSKLLVVDPALRMDAGDALKHIWLSKEFPLSDRVPDQSTADAVQGNLIRYKDTSALKKIALNVIAHKSSSDEIMELRKLFDQFDTANNGVISYEEFQEAMKKMNYSAEELETMFNSIVRRHDVGSLLEGRSKRLVKVSRLKHFVLLSHRTGCQPERPHHVH